MTASQEDFINNYLSYVGETECPMFYHRWCAMSLLGAYLGRQYSYKMGHFELHPNLYVMLIGVPGARKSTAIKIAKKIIRLAGYDYISADKTSKEKFLLDLSGEGMSDETDADKFLEQNLFGTSDSSCAQMYVACDEFNDFIGNGNIEFISLLGNLWDYSGVFRSRIKNGKSVSISDPTISILGGNTPVSFARAFPPEVLGQGFFSRLLLIYGESTGKKITFPQEPDQGATDEIVSQLQFIRTQSIGRTNVTTMARKLLDKIYKTWSGVDDIRFEHYSNRRLSHLCKIALVLSASRASTEIIEKDIIHANTILTHTEFLMPKALGEFGKSKNSDTAHKVMQILDSATEVMNIIEIWKALPNELDKMQDLAEILRNLRSADKILMHEGGFLSKKEVVKQVNSDVLNYDYLTQEERGMVK